MVLIRFFLFFALFASFTRISHAQSTDLCAQSLNRSDREIIRQKLHKIPKLQLAVLVLLDDPAVPQKIKIRFISELTDPLLEPIEPLTTLVGPSSHHLGNQVRRKSKVNFENKGFCYDSHSALTQTSLIQIRNSSPLEMLLTLYHELAHHSFEKLILQSPNSKRSLQMRFILYKQYAELSEIYAKDEEFEYIQSMPVAYLNSIGHIHLY